MLYERVRREARRKDHRGPRINMAEWTMGWLQHGPTHCAWVQPSGFSESVLPLQIDLYSPQVGRRCAWEPDSVPDGRDTILLPCSRQNGENRYPVPECEPPPTPPRVHPPTKLFQLVPRAFHSGNNVGGLESKYQPRSGFPRQNNMAAVAEAQAPDFAVIWRSPRGIFSEYFGMRRVRVTSVWLSFPLVRRSGRRTEKRHPVPYRAKRHPYRAPWRKPSEKVSTFQIY